MYERKFSNYSFNGRGYMPFFSRLLLTTAYISVPCCTSTSVVKLSHKGMVIYINTKSRTREIYLS